MNLLKKKKNLAEEAVRLGDINPEKKAKQLKKEKKDKKKNLAIEKEVQRKFEEKKKKQKEIDIDKEVDRKIEEKRKKEEQKRQEPITLNNIKKKTKKKKLKNRQLLRKYLDRAGLEEIDEQVFIKKLFRIIIIVCLVLTAGVLTYAAFIKSGLQNSIIMVAGVWTAVFALLFILSWIATYIFLDLRIFKRTSEVEEVLPDYLQLASANISAGMPIDRALWYAVRPRFGILAKEIEDVAKSTASGEDLTAALQRFAGRFDSVVLKRSINLLLVGMESGGEIAELLNKISINIQETRILKKEMAANVMTYAIFIGFASIVAAPILYALSGRLLIIIQQIMGLLAESMPKGGMSTGGMLNIGISNDAGMSQTDFGIFAISTVMITALMSGFIISVIRKGNIKEGFRIVPGLVLAALVLYLLASWALGALLGGIMSFG